MINSLPATKKKNSSLALRLLLTGSVLLALASCASTPLPPTQQLQAAELAITNAEQAGVADYASSELNQAREKLAAAHTAVDTEEMVLAQQLADESRVSAELATARAEVFKAKAVNAEMEQSLNTLKQELLRNSGTR
ncbi:MAG: DUF4398 domain-containing protein [Pseudomonadota bacterium]